MDAAGRSRVGDTRGAPRLLQDYAAFERMLGGDLRSARVRVETELGADLAGLLFRALLPGPRPSFFLPVS